VKLEPFGKPQHWPIQLLSICMFTGDDKNYNNGDSGITTGNNAGGIAQVMGLKDLQKSYDGNLGLLLSYVSFPEFSRIC